MSVFLVYVWEQYEARGGARDFQRAFRTLSEATDYAYEVLRAKDRYANYYAQVWSLDAVELVYVCVADLMSNEGAVGPY